VGTGAEKGDFKFNKQMTEVLKQNAWLAVIPIYDKLTTAPFAKNAAEYMTAKLKATSRTAITALMDAYKNLKQIQNLSQEYEAEADSYTTGAEHNKYIQKIGTEYTGFKTSYNKALEGDTSGQGLTGTQSGTTKRIAENKNNLDNILDKLIKEVILNR